MALKLLQPGIEPLGQFDIEDGDVSLVVGGEVAIFESLVQTDAYASDVFVSGPKLQLTLDTVSAVGVFHGLVDEGVAGYGTMFGSVIGATVGQGTGFGASSTSGVVVIGPSTIRGSGKATLWTKPGLYGTTIDAWTTASEFTTSAALNSGIYGDAADGTNDGKLTTTSSGNGVKVALFIGRVEDTSLVSTTNRAAGAESTNEYAAIYLLGVQV